MSTEEKILEAATDEFLTKGYDGARMRSIAESAGINKGLLHYYFKSKEALILKVFHSLFREIFSELSDIFNSELSLFEQIERGIGTYIEFLIQNPRIPFFVVGELNRDKKAHLRRMKEAKVPPPFMELGRSIEEARKRKEVKSDTTSREFMLNMMSLMLFPFVAREMIMFTQQINEKEFEAMLRNRKKQVAQLLIMDLKVKAK